MDIKVIYAPNSDDVSFSMLLHKDITKDELWEKFQQYKTNSYILDQQQKSFLNIFTTWASYAAFYDFVNTTYGLPLEFVTPLGLADPAIKNNLVKVLFDMNNAYKRRILVEAAQYPDSCLDYDDFHNIATGIRPLYIFDSIDSLARFLENEIDRDTIKEFLKNSMVEPFADQFVELVGYIDAFHLEDSNVWVLV